jgi:myo-inositol-1(or 4)-monophosphatase
MWTAIRGKPARCNNRIIRVSSHNRLGESIVSLGFAKARRNVLEMMPYMSKLLHRVRKIRIMGSAGLSMVYVAGGRFDAYAERGLRLWDIAAGGVIVESAGGKFWREAVEGKYAYQLICTNGKVRVPGFEK